MKKPKRRQQVKKVWRIFRFVERFELPDDVRFDRKRPLVYIREYVGSGQDNEAINYKRQIAACKASDNRHKLLAVFADLKDIAANYSKSYRGYILDARFEPASTAKIGQWVGLGTTECGKILKELEKIGLIERVTTPEFDTSKDEEEQGQKPSRRNSRGRTRIHGRARNRLKNKTKTESGNRNPSERKKRTGKPEPDKKKKKAKSTAQPNATGTAHAKGNAPNNPTGTDHRVGQKVSIPGNLPCRSIRSRCKKGPEQLGSIVQKLLRPPECLVFAAEVYKAIGTTYSLDSVEGKSEIGCWESAWAKALLAGLNPTYLQDLYDKTLVEARRLKLKRQRIRFRKSPEAVLRNMFDKLLAAAQARAKQADPASVMTAG